MNPHRLFSRTSGQAPSVLLAGKKASPKATQRATHRAAQLAALVALLATLPGCQSVTGSPRLSQVRAVDASPDAPGMDVYQGSAILAYNLGFGSSTSYVPIAPGGYPIIVDTASTRQQLVTASGTFLANQQYTVLVGGYAVSLQELILKDQSIPAPTGDIALRFIDQSVHTGNLDIYLVPSGATLATTKPLFTNVNFSENTNYSDYPTGTYTLAVVPTGTVVSSSTVTLYTGPAVAYDGGSAKTIVLLDATVTTVPSITAVTLKDYDPAGEAN